MVFTTSVQKISLDAQKLIYYYSQLKSSRESVLSLITFGVNYHLFSWSVLNHLVLAFLLTSINQFIFVLCFTWVKLSFLFFFQGRYKSCDMEWCVSSHCNVRWSCGSAYCRSTESWWVWKCLGPFRQGTETSFHRVSLQNDTGRWITSSKRPWFFGGSVITQMNATAFTCSSFLLLSIGFNHDIKCK